MGKKQDNAIHLYMEGIRDGNVREAVTKYTGERYKQHSTGVKDGVEGFVEFFESFIMRNPKRDIQIIRALEDGQYVFLQVYQSLNDGEAEWVTTDFFDTNNDAEIIEHWDVISAYTAKTPSGYSTTDGPTEIVDLDKTESNKEIIRDLIRNTVEGKAPEKIDTAISNEDYIEHSAEVEDGLASFKEKVLSFQRGLNYKELVLLVGQGNFVATLSKADWKEQEVAQVDLFRLENGLVVEHWDNSEPVPPESEWVNSGKF